LPARTPAGIRVYVFGDVHGRIDLLRALFSAIERDAGIGDPARSLVVGLGDYVDRSMESKAVIQAIVDGIAGCDLVALRGNHEQMLTDFLENPTLHGPAWLANGAFETLRSYDVPLTKVSHLNPRELQSIRDALARQIPLSHLMLLQGMPLTYACGSYLFVHAGVRPRVAIERQVVRDLLWIRKGFADRDRPFEKVVVHGHTPVDQPYLGRYRINLDTGAYLTNRLSCLVLEGTNVRSLDF
jgi:serine/threonine protein phosphatase 1